MTIIEDRWRKAIARQVRQDCTLAERAVVSAVADWIERPPERSTFYPPSPSAAQEYEQIRAEIVQDYSDPRWKGGRAILRRIGAPRMAASAVAFHALGLLRMINRGTYRNDPEVDRLLREARAAVSALTVAASRVNWERNS